LGNKQWDAQGEEGEMAEEIYSAQTIDIKNPFVPYAVAKLIAGILALLISLWTLIVIQGRVSTALGIGKSNGLFHRPPRPPRARVGPQRTDRTGGWGQAACTAGAARGGRFYKLLHAATMKRCRL